jgi:hypothetical protein
MRRKPPWLSLSTLAVLLSGALTVGAGSASARERYTVNGAGVSGKVIFDDGRFSAGLQGWVKDTSSDSACAELWMDFTTHPHHHFDAYVVRICGNGRAGWGRYNKAPGPWAVTINGVRTAVCTYAQNGTRKCSQQWAHDSARAGTFRLQTL